MRRISAAGVFGLFVLVTAAVPAVARIKGDYVEVRSADVYAGPCIVNSEVGLVGDQAILAWRVRAGSWEGINLDGLGVVAVVKANGTLGDRHHNPYPAKAVLILDEGASSQQRAALEHFAKAVAGQLLVNVVRVETAPIDLEVGKGEQHGRVRLVAGTLARIEARPLCHTDHLCGNEVVYYPPLVEVAHALPAYTLAEAFNGPGLGVVWKRPGKRSAFVGTFDR